MFNSKIASIESRLEEKIDSKIVSIESRLEEKIDSKLAQVEETLKSGLAKILEAFGAAAGNGRSSPPMRRQIPTQSGDTGQHTANFQHDGGRMRQGNGGNPNYSGLTRLSRLDFPRFNGTAVKDWIFNCEQFFLIDRTPEDIKVNLASIHMEDEASCWHQSVVQAEEYQGMYLDWIRYKILLLERFGEVVDDPIAELMKLRETEGIVVYHEKFEMIQTRVRLSEHYLVSAYLAGLRTDTQMHVGMCQPQSVRQCFALGKLYELAHPRMQGAVTFQGKNVFHKTGDTGKRDLGLQVKPVTVPRIQEVSKQRESSTRKWLSTEEMSERRAQDVIPVDSTQEIVPSKDCPDGFESCEARRD